MSARIRILLIDDHPVVRTGLRAVLEAESDLRSEEHTSELQSPMYLVCRLLLEKKKKTIQQSCAPTFIRRPRQQGASHDSSPARRPYHHTRTIRSIRYNSDTARIHPNCSVLCSF